MEKSERGKRRWRFEPFGAILVFLALVSAALTGFEARDDYLLAHRGVSVSALVTDEVTSEQGSTHIDVRFVTRDGRTVEAATEDYKHADRGDTIEVVYDPEHPSRVHAADWGFDYWKSAVPGIVMILVFLVAALLRFWSRARSVS